MLQPVNRQAGHGGKGVGARGVQPHRHQAGGDADARRDTVDDWHASWFGQRSEQDGKAGAAATKAGNPVAESYPRQCRNSKGKIFTEDVSGATLESKGGVSVLISSPKSDAIVSNPIQVKGRVPGSWSFEANFGVELLDANRKSVATSYATVDGNWMTNKDVTFTALVPFKPPST